MAPFVPRALRSARQLASALKNSANTASDSDSLTGNNSASARTSILNAFDPQMVAALLAAGPSSLAFRLSIGHNFGSALEFAQAVEDEGNTTAAPVSTDTPSFYTFNTSSDDGISTTSLAGSDSTLSSSSTASFPAKLSDEHLANTFGYSLNKVIDLTPSSSVTSLTSLASSTDSKASPAKKFGAAFASRWRKFGSSARKLANLGSSKSSDSINSDCKESIGHAQVSSVKPSTCSLFFDFDDESAVSGQYKPERFVPPPRSDSLPVKLNSTAAALDVPSADLESLFAGDEDPFEYEHYLDDNNSCPASPAPAVDSFSMNYLAPSDAAPLFSSASRNEDGDDTPLARLESNNILALTSTATGARTGVTFGPTLVGLGISWEDGCDYEGEVGMIGGAGREAKEAKTARRVSRVWFC